MPDLIPREPDEVDGPPHREPSRYEVSDRGHTRHLMEKVWADIQALLRTP